MSPLIAQGHESAGAPGIAPSAEQHILEDAYWAELAQSYPAYKGDSTIQAVAASPSDYDDLGQWSPVIQWPHIPVSAANLPDGRILTWASNERDAFPGGQAEYTYAATWSPSTGSFQELPHTNHDMFCAHQVVMPDGRIFVAGGRNHVRTTSVFDATSNTWTEIDDMNNGRWYPTAVAVPDGSVFVGIGSSGGRYPELWKSATGWTTLGGIDLQGPILSYTDHYEQNWWPYFHVAPSGHIIHYGPTPEMHSIEISGSGSITPVGAHNAGWYPKHGVSVMYGEGKILVAGGAISGSNLASTNKAIIVDINGPTPVITPTNPMTFARKFHNGVILPNGEVLVIGGNTSGTKFSDAGTILATEIWNPDSGAWRVGHDMQVPRNYHSIALLLTDGRVLAAGGGLCGNCAANHSDGEVYTPPYLFNADGTLASRPVITSTPTAVGFNTTFTVEATPGLQQFSLIKMSSTTHAVNTDVRFVDVAFTETSAGVYELATHSNSNVLTPGPYMLFALNSQGVPSVAAVVRAGTENIAPTITNPGSQSDIVGESVSLTVSATDPENDPLTFSASGLPTGLTINSGTGTISGTLNATGTFPVSVTVNDGNGGVSSADFYWIVNSSGTGGAWASADVGAVEVAGFSSNIDGTFEVNGSGADIWYSADEFHYVYQTMSGDGEIVARLESLSNTNGWAKAGVMFRENLLASAPFAMMVLTPSNGAAFQYRTSDGNPAAPSGGGDNITGTPHWVRLVRTGDQFTGYLSGDGVNWTLRDSVSFPASDTIFVGLAVTSHNDGVLAAGTFDSVSLIPTTDDNEAPSAPTSLAANAVSASEIGLSWTASSDSGGSGLNGYRIYRDGGSAPIATTSSASYTDSGLTENTLYSYQVSAVDGAGNESALSNTASAATPTAPANNPPLLTNPGNLTNIEGEDIAIPVEAADPDGDPLTFSATGLPPDVILGPTNGILEGVLTAAGTYSVAITVNDGRGGSDSEVFGWTVSAPAPDVTPPTNPSNLTAGAVSDTQIALTWTGSTDTGGSNLAGYNIYRDGGTTPVATTDGVNYSDDNLVANTSYVYQVTAIDNAGNESSLSNIASATTMATPTWTNLDIGAVAAAGSYSESGGTLTINGSGADIWGTSDEFQFVYRPMAGDGEIVARIESLTQAHIWTKGGVMLRESLAPDSRHAMMILSAAKGAAFQYRTTNGGSSSGGGGDTSAVAPHWVRLVRTGNTIAGFTSPDGQSWTARGSITLAGLSGTIYAGLAVTSHSDGTIATAVIDNVSLTQQVPDTIAPSVPSNLAALPLSTSDISLNWTASTDSGGSGLAGYRVYRNGSSTPVGTTTSTSYVDPGRGSSTEYSYQVSSVDGAGNESGLSNTATATTLSIPLVVDPMSSPPTQVNVAVNYSATASGSSNLQYTWNFGDGSGDTAPSTSSSVSHVFTAPGRYVVTLTVTGDDGQSEVKQLWQAIHAPLTTARPSTSMSIAYEARPAGNDRVWNVNPDNDTVSVFDVVTHGNLAEIAVGLNPRSLAVAPDGRIWSVNGRDASISIIDPTSLTVVQTVVLGSGSHPFGIVFDVNSGFAYLSLEATGEILKLNATDASEVGRVAVGPNPRHLSLSGDGSRLYVSRFITPPLPGESSGSPVTTDPSGAQLGGEVVAVDTGGLLVAKTIVLRHSDKADAEHSSRGIPNYVGPATISPDGLSAWVPSKQDNIKRGTYRDGMPLTHDSTVRAITSRIELAGESEDYPARIDHDDAAMPSTALFGRYGSYLFTALEGSREIAIIEPFGRQELLRFGTGRATQGIAISPDGQTLYAHNFMDRTVSVHDISNVVNEGGITVTSVAIYDTVASESLSPQVLAGKQLFYDAKDPRLSLQSYMSCASCHNDGKQDGRVWDLTSLGEGLRNTIRLRGHGGSEHGRPHWTANFDEIQDFEGQIRNLAGGAGLMDDADFFSGTTADPLGDPKAGHSADLDALAAYVSSLEDLAESPHRNADSTLTDDGLAGRSVFDAAACAACHSGEAFTDSPSGAMHDIGTITVASGTRLGDPLTALDTPTLRDLWHTAPYLHDGSALTLADAVSSHQGNALSASDMNLLVDYLRQIDVSEQAPQPPPDDAAPTDPSNLNAATVSDTRIDLTWSAATDTGGSGLAGYNIYRDGASTPIASTPTTSFTDTALAGSTTYSYRVSAFDGAGNESGLSDPVKATTLATPDTTAPETPTSLSATAVSESQVDLAWNASTDTGGSGVATYNVYRDGVGTPIATTTATAFSDAGLTANTTYNYQVTAIDGAGNESALSATVSATTLAPPPDTTPPADPTELTATTTGTGSIALAWTGSSDTGGSGLAAYKIYRDGATTPGATVSGTVFEDTGLLGDTTYSYQVSAVDGAGNESGLSNEASATTTVPPIWQNQDIGEVAAAGSWSENNGQHTISASGSDIWGTADEFHYAWQPMTGDGEITARVTGLTATHAWAKAGVMLRESLTANSRFAMMLVTPVNGADFQYRTSTGGAAGPSGFADGTSSVPYWVRVVREGNVLRGYKSPNGTNWTLHNSVTIALPSTIHVGLAATSHADGALTTATFDSVTVTVQAPDTTPPGTPGDLVAVANGDSQIDLNWTASSDTGGSSLAGYYVYRNGATVPIATTTGTTFSDTGLAASTEYIYQVSAVDGAGNESGLSNSATATTGEPPPPDTTAPNAPQNLSATPASHSQVNLSWNESSDIGGSGVASYRVYRDGSATPLATTSGTSYSDTGLTASTLYTYQVSAIDAAGNESELSNPAGATTLQPPLWSNQDIGAVGATGSFTESNGTVTIRGSGADIWGTLDEFHYVYQSLTGDGEITARVASLTNTHSWTKAGVMLRESLNSNSRFAMMLVTPANGADFQFRTTTGGFAGPSGTANGISAAPHWVRITREGNIVRGYHSINGVDWTLHNAVTLAMPTSVYIGLALTSHLDGTLATAEFDGIAMTVPITDTTAPSVPENLTATAGRSYVLGPTTEFSTGLKPHSIVDADVNNDGHIDLITANSDSDDGTILLGDGTGQFTVGSTPALGDHPKYVAAGYLDHDGNIDLISADQDTSTISILMGNGDGTFQRRTAMPSCGGPHEIAVVDLDSNGWSDIAVACQASNFISVYMNNGDGTLAGQVQYSPGPNPHSVIGEDINEDGNLDIVVANHGAPHSLAILLGNGDGTLQAPTTIAMTNAPHSVRASDLNGDSHIDLVTANDFGGNVSIFMGAGDGTFAAATNYETGVQPKFAGIADIDGDGIPDIATANTGGNYPTCCVGSGGDEISILMGLGDGTFAEETRHTVGLTPFSMVIRDINGDGRNDIATANWDSAATGIVLAELDSHRVGLTWDGSSDAESGISGYNLYRSDLPGSPITTVTTTSAIDSAVSASTSYTYSVSALNNASPPVESEQSIAATVTTLSDD